jgi:acetylornithine deacetylase/succinyl-diaminopimelate desuccinylase-like protein
VPTQTLELLKALVAIDSVNPSLVAGGAGEREIAAFVDEWARGCGLDTEVLEQTPGRPSVVVKARRSGGGRTLLLCGHCDTVTVDGMRDPHTPRLDRDRLQQRRHPLLGRASVHASTIQGGEELSSYPARCTVGIERRTLPGETAATVGAVLGTLPRSGSAYPPRTRWPMS